MKSSSEILADVAKTFATKWETRDGQVVPDPSAIKLGNDAVKLDGTVLYADMKDSTDLVDNYKDWFAAEIYKSYLLSACHVIRNNHGEITSFDGDRVMAVFIGASKNSIAVKAALQICYIVQEINNKLKSAYPSTSYSLHQSIGIDSSPIFAARTGIRNANDLVWVGPAANHAAKFCAEANETFPVVISEGVYKKLNDESKFGGSPSRDMWERHSQQTTGLTLYRSSWHWKF
jgi:class 3 adenylate cyclase